MMRYPLSYEHVTELMAERGVEVDASCIWRWVQAYAPELNKRCRAHLKPVNKSYRVDETYIRLRCKFKIEWQLVECEQLEVISRLGGERSLPELGHSGFAAAKWPDFELPLFDLLC
jgi:transposase-like protein